MRAQTSLPAVGLALVVLLAATTAVVAVADEQLRSQMAPSLERADAAAVADALIQESSPLTRRENVLNEKNLDALDAEALVAQFGLDPTNGARITLEDRVLAERGRAAGGSTINRIVLIERRTQRTLEPPFRAGPVVTLPRRSPNVTLRITPGGNRTVNRVRANNRIILANSTGLSGHYTAAVSRHRTITLRFEGGNSLKRGDVGVTYYPARTRKARLTVTVKRRGAVDG
ncbi:MAG: hypothetical protein ABEH64_09715 [Salinirussus sp.]